MAVRTEKQASRSESGRFERHEGEIGFNKNKTEMEEHVESQLSERVASDDDGFIVNDAIWNDEDDEEYEERETDGSEETEETDGSENGQDSEEDKATDQEAEESEWDSEVETTDDESDWSVCSDEED
mgnify:CR=1 FL=1